jgi:glycerol-3-phosphate dehydrogenase
MSERVCAEVFRVLGRTPDARIDSAEVPLAGGDEPQQKAARLKYGGAADRALEDRLWSAHGLAAASMLDEIRANPDLADPVGGLSALTRAEVEHAVRSEMVVTLDDLLRRRSRVAMFDTKAAIAAAPEVARTLGRLLGWSEERVATETIAATTQWQAELDLVRQA